MQDSIIEIVNRKINIPDNECTQLANKYKLCVFPLVSKYKIMECSKFLDDYLRCKNNDLIKNSNKNTD
jgi:hypothetical protein